MGAAVICQRVGFMLIGSGVWHLLCFRWAILSSHDMELFIAWNLLAIIYTIAALLILKMIQGFFLFNSAFLFVIANIFGILYISRVSSFYQNRGWVVCNFLIILCCHHCLCAVVVNNIRYTAFLVSTTSQGHQKLLSRICYHLQVQKYLRISLMRWINRPHRNNSTYQ